MQIKEHGNGSRLVCGALLFGCLAAIEPMSARGADLYTPAVYDSVVYWGVDFSKSSGEDSIGADAGIVLSLNGDIGSSGFTLTANGGFGRTDGSFTDTDAVIGSLLAGYVWHTPEMYFSLGSGVHIVRNEESPGGGPNDGTDVGVIVQYGFETKADDALYVQSYGSLSTAFDQRYIHAKLGYKTSQLRFGGEVTAFDDQSSDPVARFGGFVGDIPVFGTVSMVVSAGYQHDYDPGQSDGFYAQVGFSTPLSLR